MSTIFILFIGAIYLFIYLDAVQLDDPDDDQSLAYRRQGQDLRDNYWPDSNFGDVNTGRRDEVWDTIHKELDDEDSGEIVSNDGENKYKRSTAQLVVRNRLATTLKQVLEEMIKLITEDIENTNKLVNRQSTGLKDNILNDNDSDESISVNHQKLHQNERWTERINGNVRRIGEKFQPDHISPESNNYIVKPARESDNYRVLAKLRRSGPNELLLTYGH